jgi:hypothetical protein
MPQFRVKLESRLCWYHARKSYEISMTTFGAEHMPMQYIKNAAQAAVSVLDVNGDGVIDHKDALAAAKIAGAATVGVGATAAAGAIAGSSIVATGAAAIASKVAMVGGAAAGAFIAGTFGATTTITAGIVHYGSIVVIGSSTATSVSAPLLAAAASAGSWAAQVATGKIADMAIIKSVALTKAVAAGEVILIGGVPMGVTAAITAGLIAIVIVGAYAYYILTKDSVSEDEVTGLVPGMG